MEGNKLKSIHIKFLIIKFYCYKKQKQYNIIIKLVVYANLELQEQ